MDDAPDEDRSGMNLLSNVAAVVMQETTMSDSENRGTPCSSSPPLVVHYPYCNFPLTYDPMFQQAFTHRARFADFLIATDRPPAAARELFKKELTPSDVGKLNRLVIPKKYAVRYFPEMQCTPSSSSSSTNKDVIVNNDEGTMLEFRDREGELWVFRYCYWRSSQSFVFTKGWNKFVKAKKLCSRDTVAFYTSDERRSGRTYFVIDAHYTSREECGGEEEAAVVNDNRSDGKGEEQEEGSGGTWKKNGFKLFGTFIEPATTN